MFKTQNSRKKAFLIIIADFLIIIGMLAFINYLKGPETATLKLDEFDIQLRNFRLKDDTGYLFTLIVKNKNKGDINIEALKLNQCKFSVYSNETLKWSEQKQNTKNYILKKNDKYILTAIYSEIPANIKDHKIIAEINNLNLDLPLY